MKKGLDNQKLIEDRVWPNYTMAEVAKMLGTGRARLFVLLKSYQIINGKYARPELVLKGYFENCTINISKNNFNKSVNAVRVTKKGFKFLKIITKLLNPSVL